MAHITARFCLLILTASCVFACTAARPVTPDPREGDDAVAFFSDPPIYWARVSPSGDAIAFLRTIEDQPSSFVLNLKSGKVSPLVAFPDMDYQLAWIEWANDGRLLMSVDMEFPDAPGGTYRSRLLYAINRDGSDLEHLGRRWFGRQGKSRSADLAEIIRTPIQFEDDIIDWLRDDPQHVLISLRKPDRRRPSPGVYRLDVESGDLDREQRPHGKIGDWRTDGDGKVRLGIATEKTQRTIYGRIDPEGEWMRLASWDVWKESGFAPLGLADHDPAKLLVLSNRETGRMTLHEFDMRTRKVGKQIFGHPTVDIGGVVWDDYRNRYVGLTYVEDEPEIRFFNTSAEKEQASIDAALPGRHNRILSQAHDGSVALISSGSSSVAPSYFYFDRAKRAMAELQPFYPGLAGRRLATPRADSYRARDGLEIPAYLTIPVGKEARALPFVVLPHGGPMVRDTLEFDLVAQYLAARGYGVLQMNYRGSSGYGSRYQSLGYRQWGLAMQDDVTDGTRWLIDEGLADPDRIAIYGASYGGYAALMGAAKEPGLYRCAASYAGVTDLVKLLDDLDRTGSQEYNAPRIGTDPEVLRQTSPVNLADKIKVPVLLGHGRGDAVVPVGHSEEMADALEDAGKRPRLKLYDAETHGSRDQRNMIDWHRRVGAFLDECTAPHSAPTGAGAAASPAEPSPPS